MKKLLIALAFCLPAFAFSQEMEGTIRYLVTHNWTKKMAAIDYISKQQREKIAYMWGNRSEWKLYTTLNFTPTESKYEDSEERAEADDEGYSWRKDAYTIRRYFDKNRASDLMNLLGKDYLVEDSIAAPTWKIQNDLKEVAGHLCMNATWFDSLKLQRVVAWFALDLPISAGPERLGDLPGLILEADFNDGGMLISADKIELKKLTTELVLPKKIKAKRINEQEYRKLVKTHFDEKRKAEEPPFWGMRY